MNSTTAERSLVSNLVARLEIRMLALALVLGAVLSILSPHFLTSNNLWNVLDQSVVVGIVAIGMTFVILIGGIDLSVGSVAGLTGVILGRGLEHFPIPAAIVLAVLAGDDDRSFFRHSDRSIRPSGVRRHARRDGHRSQPGLHIFGSDGHSRYAAKNSAISFIRAYWVSPPMS